MVVYVLFVLAGLLLVLLVYSVLMNIWLTVPYVPTPPAIVETMLKLADIQPDDHVYDLGAGDGRLLIGAAREQSGAAVTGYEYTPSVFLWGWCRIFLSRTKAKLRFANALRQQYSDADVIFSYLSPQLMKKLEVIFTQQLKPGTRVISHAFRFPGREPQQTCTVQARGRPRHIYLYVWE